MAGNKIQNKLSSFGTIFFSQKKIAFNFGGIKIDIFVKFKFWIFLQINIKI